MKVKFNEFLATVYASLFNCTLTSSEAKLWVVGKRQNMVLRTNVLEHPEKIRETRRQISREKLKIAQKIVKMLRKIPFIEGLFLTGSVAAWNAFPGADIDLMIIASPNTLWLTRMVVVGLLKVTGHYRSRGQVMNKVCTNIFLDTNHLKIREKNLYTAHEVLQAECLFDRGGIKRRWLRENSWTKAFLPEAYKDRVKGLQNEVAVRSDTLKRLFCFGLAPFELVALLGQFFYMRSRITREKVSWGEAVFHPNDLTAKIYEKWCAKLVKLKYNKTEATDIFFSKS
jgi:predicted nucleotidyltransferase